jgi:hypothetical protein
MKNYLLVILACWVMLLAGCGTLCWGPKHEGDPNKPVLMTNDDGSVTEVDIDEVVK